MRSRNNSTRCECNFYYRRLRFFDERLVLGVSAPANLSHVSFRTLAKPFPRRGTASVDKNNTQRRPCKSAFCSNLRPPFGFCHRKLIGLYRVFCTPGCAFQENWGAFDRANQIDWTLKSVRTRSADDNKQKSIFRFPTLCGLTG